MNLTKDTFIGKLADLMAWYVNFKFQIKDDSGEESYQFMKWYEAFQEFNDEDFDMIVESYMKENVYPPSSPTSILEHAKIVLINMNKGEIDKAWLRLKSLISAYGFKSEKIYSPITNDYIIVNRLNQALKNEKDQKILSVFNTMFSKISSMNSNNEDWVRKEFFEIYEALMVEEIRNGVNQGKIAIDGTKNKMIGEKK